MDTSVFNFGFQMNYTFKNKKKEEKNIHPVPKV